MKPKNRIFVLDGVMGEFGEVSNAQMRRTRSADLLMLALFNAKERTKNVWKALIEGSDPRLVVKQIKQTSVGSSRHLIEVGLRHE
jgi:6-hydroxytryprostatin B O-methyltransferase